MYGGWSGSAEAYLMVENSRCNCAPAQANFAYTRPNSIAFYVGPFEDPEREAMIAAWLESGRQWWNDWLAATGSTKQIYSGGGWPIVPGDLPGTVAMEFTNVGGEKIIIDVGKVFGFTSDHAKTLLAHELGHALGVMGHSSCGESQSIMAATVNSAHAGLYDADKCWAWAEYRHYPVTCGQ